MLCFRLSFLAQNVLVPSCFDIVASFGHLNASLVRIHAAFDLGAFPLFRLVFGGRDIGELYASGFGAEPVGVPPSGALFVLLDDAFLLFRVKFQMLEELLVSSECHA